MVTTASRGGSVRHGTLRTSPGPAVAGANRVTFHLALTFAADVFWGAAGGAGGVLDAWAAGPTHPYSGTPETACVPWIDAGDAAATRPDECTQVTGNL